MGLPYQSEDYDGGGSGITFTDPISIGTGAGAINQGISSVAIGTNAGNDTQEIFSVAIGRNAGQTTQGGGCVAIGNNAGQNNQSGSNGFAVAIGWEAGQTNQGEKTFAMGVRAGNSNQGSGSFALGEQAGETNQGASCIAIGKQAGETNQNNNTIVLNAQGTPLNTTATNGFYVAPIASGSTGNYLQYNTTTKQITYDSGAITAPTYKTTAIPTLTNEIGYYQVKSIPSSATVAQFPGSLMTFFDLDPGVHIVKCAVTLPRQTSGANYSSVTILKQGFGGSNITENFTVVVDNGWTTNYVNDTIVVPYGTTLRVEFWAYVGANATSTIQTSFATKCSAVRIA